MSGDVGRPVKKLYLIGGTMGVGKTTVCQILKKKLDRAVFLDGDWCWDADPFQVNEETKEMVMSNITCLLYNFIRCSAYENIIFCWVMHEQEIIDRILSALDTERCDVRAVSLVCGEEALVKRLEKDVRRGLRQPDVVERSVGRIRLYDKLDTIKVDVSEISAEEAAEILMNMA